MTICVTRKLATNIKLNAERLPSAPLDRRQRWYANLIRADRVKYMLVTDATTLVSVVFAGRRNTTPESFAKAVAATLREYFHYREWDEALRTFDIDTVAVEFTKTDDRRVLGSMNDFGFQVQWLLAERGYTLDYLCNFLNRNPMSYLGYNSPEGVMEELLAECRRTS